MKDKKVRPVAARSSKNITFVFFFTACDFHQSQKESSITAATTRFGKQRPTLSTQDAQRRQALLLRKKQPCVSLRRPCFQIILRPIRFRSFIHILSNTQKKLRSACAMCPDGVYNSKHRLFRRPDFAASNGHRKFSAGTRFPACGLPRKMRNNRQAGNSPGCNPILFRNRTVLKDPSA